MLTFRGTCVVQVFGSPEEAAVVFAQMTDDEHVRVTPLAVYVLQTRLLALEQVIKMKLRRAGGNDGEPKQNKKEKEKKLFSDHTILPEPVKSLDSRIDLREGGIRLLL